MHLKHTHTRLKALCPGLPGVRRYQKGKTNLDFTEARDSEWQWHQLGRTQLCTSLQTDEQASTPSLSFLQPGCPSRRPTNSVKALYASETDQIMTPACWNEIRRILLVTVLAADYRMHFQVVAKSENQLHLAASTPQPACWQSRHSLHQSWNSPEQQQFQVNKSNYKSLQHFIISKVLRCAMC